MPQTSVGVGCGVLVFNKKGQFLMLKRLSKHATGTYCLPGGWLEYGETFEAVAEREVMEEVGVKIESIKVLGVTNNVFPAEGKHTVSVIMAARMKEGETPVNGEPEKCESIAWYDDWDNLPQPTMVNYSEYITKADIEKYVKSVL